MAWGKKNGGGRGIAWLALLASLAALFLSWKAYERTGGRLAEDLPRLNREVSVGEPAPADWRRELERARERLLDSRDDPASGRDLRDLDDTDVARMRESLARSFRDAGGEVRRGWRELDADLERLQGELRQRSSRARETLESALQKMSEVGR